MGKPCANLKLFVTQKKKQKKETSKYLCYIQLGGLSCEAGPRLHWYDPPRPAMGVDTIHFLIGIYANICFFGNLSFTL